MAGKQAKILSEDHVQELLLFAQLSRRPARNRLIVLLSVRAGLRAAEIAKLDWEMVVDASGRVAELIELQDRVAKKRHGRRIPMHTDLRAALVDWHALAEPIGPVISSERGERMQPRSIVNWFAAAYRTLGLTGCSSHSGRRTFITRAARLVPQAGGSLRDVQLLAGHRSIETTQRYIDGDTDIQRRLVALL
jgi:integrase/recombinase XerD